MTLPKTSVPICARPLVNEGLRPSVRIGPTTTSPTPVVLSERVLEAVKSPPPVNPTPAIISTNE